MYKLVSRFVIVDVILNAFTDFHFIHLLLLNVSTWCDGDALVLTSSPTSGKCHDTLTYHDHMFLHFFKDYFFNEFCYIPVITCLFLGAKSSFNHWL